uniref:Uncharacterized protein n=1 Tax=Medicago truncatula TaxID=3880 RepID=I3T9Z2_MEDTR|nr:unknown [Medicago truncatula]
MPSQDSSRSRILKLESQITFIECRFKRMLL